MKCKYKCDTGFINYSKTPFNTTYIDYKSSSPISSYCLLISYAFCALYFPAHIQDGAVSFPDISRKQ